MASPVPGVDAVRSALVRLRTRSGLSAERLRSTEVGVASILELPVVRQIVGTSSSSAPEAAVEAIRQLAAQLSTTDLVVVDVALSLDILGERFPESPELAELYAADVGDRREKLVEQWAELHRLLGVEKPPKQPTVRSLRSTVEARAIARLAALCVGSSLLDVTAAEQADDTETVPGTPRVAVIGSAVMDHMFSVDHVPETGTSTRASSFELHPGGKGLNHAVASARLDMDVHLIAAVGDDEPGRALLDYMTADGLRLNLVKVVPNARTPVVGVLVTRNGGTATIAWDNETEVRLEPADFHTTAVSGVLDSVDAVVMTFEPPVETIRAALETIGQQKTKPLLVVRPSPPLPNPQQLYENFQNIDYLIGTQRELRELLPGSDRNVTTESLATSLLMLGVHGVCITEEFGCMIRSEHNNVDIARFPAAMRDTPGAREAFSAALIHRLLKKNRMIEHEDLEWATAAMAAAQSFGGVADSMPKKGKVDRVLQVTPGDERS